MKIAELYSMNKMTKKLWVTIMMVPTLLLWDCVKEIDHADQEIELHEVVFHAGMDNETKTVLQEDGRVFWAPGDRISLFTTSGTNGGYQLNATIQEPLPETEFVGMIREGSKYSAIYPYSDRNYFDGTKFGIEFHSEQVAGEGALPTPKDGYWDRGTFYSIAQSTDENLYFMNICGGIKVSFTQEGVTKLNLRSQSGLSGTFEYTIDENGIPQYLNAVSRCVDLTVWAPNYGTFEPGKYYYITLPARPIPDGLSIDVYKGEQYDTWTYEQPLEIHRSAFKLLYGFDDELFNSIATIQHDSYSGWLHGIDRARITKMKFHTQDDTVTDKTIRSDRIPIYYSINGTELDIYTTAEYIDASNITCSMFSGFTSIRDLDLSHILVSNATNMCSMFSGCNMLQSLDLSSFETSQVTNMSSLFMGCSSLRTLNLSSFDTSSVEDMNNMFNQCMSLESLTLSNFNTSKVRSTYFMFGWCRALKDLDISSFTAEALETAELMFSSCIKLQKLDLGSFDLSNVNTSQSAQGLMANSKAGAVRCISGTRTKLKESIPSSVADRITWMSLSEDIDTYVYPINPSLYYSSDFSKHETVRRIYSASKGKGIDIVLMGDAYSDRMIESGLYDEDMELVVDALFSKEPLASYKDHFNIYVVYLVSDNEVLGESTALDGIPSAVGMGQFGDYASANVPSNYRILATGNSDLTVQDAIVVVNGTDHVSGYTNMAAWNFDTHIYDCDYGRGYSSVVVGRGKYSDKEEFKVTIAHEYGHAFAKLADEYVTYDSSIEEAPYGDIILNFKRFGWYKNVDITSNAESVRWSQFLNDSRYANEHLGAYEGGMLYRYGVWRSSENSIMRHGTEFNAPSRAAIYNRIHKLAYGSDWQFDYETFVQQDLKNIPSVTKATSVRSVPYPARVNNKPLFKMEESTTPDGKKMVTVIMD